MSAVGSAPAGGVEIRGLRKVYGDTVALAALDLYARPGEILGVVGPNGAGKSTMVKILAGETPATAGEILVDGARWSREYGSKRVAIVHQEAQLFPNLTVADNIIVGREERRVIRRGSTAVERAVMKDLAIEDVADTRLEFVPLATQQRTEIARALVQDARVFLFDEPNSSLTADESADLFRRMHGLADAGRVVILVSHRLAEVVAHCARVAVLLDGMCHRVFEGAQIEQESIARELVVGHESSIEGTIRAGAHDERRLGLANWSHRAGAFSDVSFEIRAGEIVAIVGVEGSGARELVRSMAGFEPCTGSIFVNSATTGGDPPARTGTTSTGTGYVPSDRSASLFGNLSIADNIVVRLNREISGRAGALSRQRMASIARAAGEQYLIKARSLRHPVSSLSGGNQQKLAIAEAMVPRPTVLVLEEPTRGVDVSSKREIYRHLRQYASEGQAIVIFSTETPELFEVADRVHVMAAGQLSPALLVPAYANVEALAADVTRLERHHVRGDQAELSLPLPA